MPEPEITCAELEDQLFLRFAGDVRQTEFSDLSKTAQLYTFIETQFEQERFKSVVIDVEHVVAMDSTHLGLLARLAVLTQQHLGVAPVLYAPTEKPIQLLHAMGMEGLFIICKTPWLASVDDQPLPEEQDADATEAVLAAHKTLAELNEANKASFKTLIALLESEAG